jgi:hypothetical protein
LRSGVAVRAKPGTGEDARDREAEITISKQIEELVQFNQAHAFSYDREALVRMLDAALARWKLGGGGWVRSL